MTRPHHSHIGHVAGPVMIAPAHECVIEMCNVTKRYGKVAVFDDIDPDVLRDKMLSIVGGSGSGKTTLLHQVMGLEKPSLDTIHIFGEELACQVGNDLQLMRNRWGMQFQHGALFSALSVIGNVALPTHKLRILSSALIQCMAMFKLQMVRLKSADTDKTSSDLSGGMIKCVTLVRVPSLEPELVFLDKPTVGLDPRASNDYVTLICELRQELSLTVVMVTYDLDTLVALFDRITVLAGRRVVVAKPLDQATQVDHPLIRECSLGERDKRTLSALGSQMAEAVVAASLSTQKD